MQRRDDNSVIMSVSLLCHFGLRSSCKETAIQRLLDQAGLGILAKLWQKWPMFLNHFRNKYTEYFIFLTSFMELLSAFENEGRIVKNLELTKNTAMV